MIYPHVFNNPGLSVASLLYHRRWNPERRPPSPRLRRGYMENGCSCEFAGRRMRWHRGKIEAGGDAVSFSLCKGRYRYALRSSSDQHFI